RERHPRASAAATAGPEPVRPRVRWRAAAHGGVGVRAADPGDRTARRRPTGDRMSDDLTGVPTAIDALVDTLTRELAGAHVFDGPSTSNVTGDAVWVGITPDDPSLDTFDTPAGLGRTQITFDVTCLARSGSGSANIRAQRARAYALVGRVKSLLRVDPTLGGVVMNARLAGSLYTPYFTEQGQ